MYYIYIRIFDYSNRFHNLLLLLKVTPCVTFLYSSETCKQWQHKGRDQMWMYICVACHFLFLFFLCDIKKSMWDLKGGGAKKRTERKAVKQLTKPWVVEMRMWLCVCLRKDETNCLCSHQVWRVIINLQEHSHIVFFYGAYVLKYTCVLVSKWGLVLKQFVQQRSVAVSDAHGARRYVLQDVNSPTQAPVDVVGVPRRVALPGHVDFYERTLRFGGGGSGPHLEDGKTRLSHIFVRLWLDHVGWGGRGSGRGRWG